MNLPNKLTVFRIILIPVFLILVLPVFNGRTLLLVPAETGRIIAAVVFVLASFTDYLDGKIARKRNCVTTFGKFLDPIADKLLVTSALMALIQLGDISAWAAVIIIAREFIVTGIRIMAASDGVVIAASSLGKAKTLIQMLAVFFILLRDFPFSMFTSVPVGRILLWIAVLLTIYSGYDYLKANWDRIKN
ncbi:MAG: CDP-diacylglycerol--glycerol-3-phosphate 3-phosphatidyltransferase [Clostridiaceae bacterium]|nr:CDP-diacylglycerol--glycerol-3-phosphate 3-phosphatidyltransferase [Clostridiaceae bacterium]